jgi:glycerol-3-phosphate O-acyltransferase
MNREKYSNFMSVFKSGPAYNPSIIQKELLKMECSINLKAIKITSYLTNKILRNSQEGMYVKKSGLLRIKELLAKGERVVLMPMFKSFFDVFLISYSLLDNGIKFPFTIGCAEDTPNIRFINTLLNSMGIILNRREADQSAEISYINQAVLREIIEQQKFAIMFLNDQRIRSGKLSRPILPSQSITWLLQAYAQSMQSEGKTVHMVPLVINHERLFDIRHLATEMVSGVKKTFNVADLSQLIKQEGSGRLGKVFLNYLNPISLKEYVGE